MGEDDIYQCPSQGNLPSQIRTFIGASNRQSCGTEVLTKLDWVLSTGPINEKLDAVAALGGPFKDEKLSRDIVEAESTDSHEMFFQLVLRALVSWVVFRASHHL